MSVCLISQSQAAPLGKMRPEIILKKQKQNHKLIVIKTDNDVFTTVYDGDVQNFMEIKLEVVRWEAPDRALAHSGKWVA